ncbi:hypothetical protein ACFPTR_11320 [Aliibacillus thermotolerans]|uniref:Uncharacterized protein n=1 Tax=Aliibacillus thermotolerans TaxID=1834418 RepID=A0ABW0U7H1_9BACI|nr:hypothetical protein [Aliibacillus thermotolerans]MDA3129767.1 hypothetical protein [Aliibacillus thermotolerans]
MEQIQLQFLLEFLYPERLELLKEEELQVPVVFQDGLRNIKQKDIDEIVEAVIMEGGKDAIIH